MSTTTTNFGWTIPSDTDLVKDGASAMRTLGNGIDSSMGDLKGGTTGQVLTKASNTDMDFSWTAVDPLVILDAKGDLISATAADTPARLPVGTNGQVLVADSTTSTGLKWDAAPAASGPTFRVTKTNAQACNQNTATKITWDAETFDTDNNFASNRFTPTKAGYYSISAYAFGADNRGKVELYKNGASYSVVMEANINAAGAWSGADLVYMNGSTDYLELYVTFTGGNYNMYGSSHFAGIWTRS